MHNAKANEVHSYWFVPSSSPTPNALALGDNSNPQNALKSTVVDDKLLSLLGPMELWLVRPTKSPLKLVITLNEIEDEN